VRTRRGGGEAVAAISGDIDIVNGPHMVRVVRRMVEESRPPRVVLDLTEATFIDSSGMHAMLDLRSDAKRFAYHLVLVLPETPGVRRPLEISGLLRLFDVRDSP
jgi:anti-sigma B factor antagonist